MKRFLAILLLASCVSACAQTGITVMADTNRVIRTNFFLSNSQVQGLTNLLDAKQTATAALTNLSTNNGGSLTNLTGGSVIGAVALASNISGIVSIANGGTGSASASNARVALGLGTAATNPASAFQAASTNLDTLALNNGGALTNLSATNFLPAYSNNAGKVLSVATGSTNIEWIAISNTVTDGSTITNLPLSNTVGTLSVLRGGTGATNASDARINLLPAYTNNASKVLALNTNATDVEWITITNTGGGGTSGVTSVDVSGGSTGLTTSGGPITNSGTITLGGTLSIAAGGTGQTNAALAIEALLPAYTNNSGKVLGLDTNLALIWTTNAGGGGGGGSGTVTSIDASGGSTGMNFTGGPVTNSGTLTLGGTLAIGSGGTGASDVTNARVALLPAYTNNAGKALVLNTNATDITWATIPSVPVSIANGGTAATNSTNALINLGVIKDASSVALLSADAGNQSVVIGRLASALSNNAIAIGNGAFADAADGVAVGNGASSSLLGAAFGAQSSATDGAAVGYSADTARGGAVGYNAESINGFAGGLNARTFSTNAVQLGTGTNSSDETIQFRNAGSVTTNAWSALANSTVFGHYVMAAPTNGTANQVLALNSNATAAVWTSAGSGIIDLSTTNATGILPVAKGGTGATNVATALTNLGVYTDDAGTPQITIGVSQTITGSQDGIAIGRSVILSNSDESIAIGWQAKARSGSRSVAIGYLAFASNAAGAVQLGEGTNSTSSTIQFRNSGNVDGTEWGYLANASTRGGYAMTNTAAISTNRTFVAYDGTNYVTNSVTISNGIITGWTQ